VTTQPDDEQLVADAQDHVAAVINELEQLRQLLTDGLKGTERQQ
jgi:hypothetical protein